MLLVFAVGAPSLALAAARLRGAWCPRPLLTVQLAVLLALGLSCVWWLLYPSTGVTELHRCLLVLLPGLGGVFELWLAARGAPPLPLRTAVGARLACLALTVALAPALRPDGWFSLPWYLAYVGLLPVPRTLLRGQLRPRLLLYGWVGLSALAWAPELEELPTTRWHLPADAVATSESLRRHHGMIYTFDAYMDRSEAIYLAAVMDLHLVDDSKESPCCQGWDELRWTGRGVRLQLGRNLSYRALICP